LLKSRYGKVRWVCPTFGFDHRVSHVSDSE